MPIGDQRAQDLRASEKRARRRSRAAECDGGETVGALPPITLLVAVPCAKSHHASFSVSDFVQLVLLLPTGCRRQEKSQQTIVRLNDKTLQSVIVGRRIALQDDWGPSRFRGQFNGRNQFDVMFDIMNWRKKDVQNIISGFDAKRRARGTTIHSTIGIDKRGLRRADGGLPRAGFPVDIWQHWFLGERTGLKFDVGRFRHLLC